MAASRRRRASSHLEIVPECPAYAICCKAERADCAACLRLDVAAWREHVAQVLVATKLAP